MDSALIVSAVMLGLAGTPHCAAMCAAPCAAAVGQGGRTALLSFQLARVLSYAAVGAVVASSMGALAALSEAAPMLRPLWTLVQAACLTLGLWLLWQGRQPAWMGSIGKVPAVAVVAMPQGRLATASAGAGAGAGASAGFGMGDGNMGSGPSTGSRTVPANTAGKAWKAALAGGLWAAWPCGLLHSALLVAALTGGAAAGATAMAGFAVASSGGLLLGPWLRRRWLAKGGADTSGREVLLVRLSGLLLVLAAGWALGHGLWPQVAMWCGLA